MRNTRWGHPYLTTVPTDLKTVSDTVQEIFIPIVMENLATKGHINGEKIL